MNRHGDSDGELLGDSKPAIPSMKVASEKELPAEPNGDDPCKTPFAHAVVPESLTSEKEPTSRDLLLDDRVERLLKENYELLKERKELRDIAQARGDSSTARLLEMREAKRLVRAFVEKQESLADDDFAQEEFAAIAAWAEKPI